MAKRTVKAAPAKPPDRRAASAAKASPARKTAQVRKAATKRAPKPRAKAVRKAGLIKPPARKPVRRASKAARIAPLRIRLPSDLNSASAPIAISASGSSPVAPAPLSREPESQPMAFVDRGMPVPDNYGLDRLVVQVRDPQWLFCYWELHGPKLIELRAQRGQSYLDACAWVLRLYRINEGCAVDMEIEPAIGNWYINVGRTGKYQLELGLLSPEGEWVSLLVSQIVETPAQGPSEVVDEEWRMRPEDEEALLRPALELAEAGKRGVSGFLGASRMQSSFGLVSSLLMLGASGSGRPVAGSWAWSFSPVGASGRMSSPGSGGVGWLIAPTGAHEPLLERPLVQGGGPNWNAQPDLPRGNAGKTQQPHFKVKLPRVLHGLPLPQPTWPAKPRNSSSRKKARCVVSTR